MEASPAGEIVAALIALLKPAIYLENESWIILDAGQINFSLEDVENISFNRILDSFGAAAGVIPESRPLVYIKEICEDLFNDLSVIQKQYDRLKAYINQHGIKDESGAAEKLARF